MTENSQILKMKSEPAVIAHVEMMQGIISRMAENSAKCKEWCFALLGALMVLIYSIEVAKKIDFEILYCLIGLFSVLDAFYLGLERNHKDSLNSFIEKINRNQLVASHIFLPYGSGRNSCLPVKMAKQLISTVKGIFSFSIILPYGLMFLITYIFHPIFSCNC